MNISVEIGVDTGSNERCSSVLEAIEPDNYLLPHNISIHMKCVGKVLAVQIESSDPYPLTLRNTIDDILEHISLATKTLDLIHIQVDR